MQYDHIRVPEDGTAITINPDHSLNVPDNPVIPFIEGDGIGIDVSPVMLDVVKAAVERAYAGAREIKWMQVYAGQKAADIYGDDEFLPDETLHALKNFVVSIKGPFAERSHSPDARSLRLCAADPLFPRSEYTDEGVGPGQHGRVS